MSRSSRYTKRASGPLVFAESVGSAEFRANLAKYLKQARSGRPVIIRERGKSSFLLSRLDDDGADTVLGCMRDRTEYVRGAVVNARETWSGGGLP
jgi:antitoxin (DNA-binding transcriptional repressor) of toxin-antitoxin stability system